MSDCNHKKACWPYWKGVVEEKDQRIVEQARMIADLHKQLADAIAERDYLQRQLDEVWS